MSDSTAPLISIIVAVFNGDKTLQQCIDSVASQTYINRELIIIDGASTDGTVGLLEANSGRIEHWISEPDNGIYNAWNKGLKQAKGDWICFLGADDYFSDSQVLDKIAARLAVLPDDIRVAYGQIMLLSYDDEILYPIGEPWPQAKKYFKQVMSVPHPGLMHRRSLFEQHGEFDESFHIAGDYELLLRELKTADAAFIPDVITVNMRQGGISSSLENAMKTMQEARQAQKINGIPFPGIFWIMALAKIYLRLLLWRVLGEKVTKKTLDLYRRLIGQPSYWTKT